MDLDHSFISKLTLVHSSQHSDFVIQNWITLVQDYLVLHQINHHSFIIVTITIIIITIIIIINFIID